jgi:2-dehydro-3-deoxyphosphogluconate aldolase/(4S)-4-hydroxy-2-oxoglutarate aldolase
MFSFTKKDGNSSIFVDTAFEIMKSPYLGKNGHIAIGTNYIHRAIAYMEMLGVEFDEETAKRDAKGNLKAIYAKGEVAGFAIHLVQK